MLAIGIPNAKALRQERAQSDYRMVRRPAWLKWSRQKEQDRRDRACGAASVRERSPGFIVRVIKSQAFYRDLEHECALNFPLHLLFPPRPVFSGTLEGV